ncbi:MAG TPA: VIT domain-containing protein [Tepidisphaeraceae bacterium]|nr:VIT domain-containing protein [Tepidisphaeraceae bacterium]
MQRIIRAAWAILAGWVALAPAAARADGFIVIHDGPQPVPVPTGHFSFAPLEVSYHHVTVDIKDNVATTSVDQEFVNPNSLQLEGTYLFPLPPGAHIDKFSMDVNGKQQEAELLPADKARAIYESIVRQRKDPALLEYIGRDTFKVRIFPIEPNSKKQVKIKYTQLLKSDTGLTEYTYPLNTEKFSARPLKNVSVKVNLAVDQPLKAVYCPSHAVEIKRDGDKKATIGYEERNVRPDMDFKVVFSKEAKNDVGISLLTYRNPGDGEGYFLLLASPGIDVKNKKVQPKDVCLVLDTSGSMAGKKMEQAKKALAFCLANMNEQDRFEIVRFSTEAEGFFDELKPANKENVQKAQQFVASLKPIGGTAIDEALQKAMKLGKDSRAGKDADRPYVVIFLTDGVPTIGETSQEKILGNLTKANPGQVRVFSFGIGTDINTHLLDKLAEGTRAFSQYVLPEEDVEVKLSNFYTKIKDPVLANLEVAVSGGDVKATQLYPGQLGDLFKGDQLVVFGKYTGKGAGAVKVTGTLAGEKKTFAQDVQFTENDTKNDFIPRLWATRRVGFLLDEIRKNGETKELKDEVVRLARAHGIVTPYTAYLILEDEARRGVPVAVRTMRELEADRPALDAAKAVYDTAAAEWKDGKLRGGDLAVANAANINGLKVTDNLQQAQQGLALDKGGSFAVTPPTIVTGGVSAGAGGAVGGPATPAAASGEALTLGRNAAGTVVLGDAKRQKEADERQAQGQASGYRSQGNYANQARVVRGRAFYQNGNTWTDNNAAVQKDLKRKEVKFGSDEYFALIKENADAAAWLSLGNEVDVVIGETLYVVR